MSGPLPAALHAQHHLGHHATAAARSFVARQASVDVGGGVDNGCCLVKALISNLLTFAT